MKIKIFLLSTIILMLFLSCINEMARNKIKQDEYKGIIVDKYKESINHDARTFMILIDNNNYETSAEFWPYAWEYASVGDSIIKPKDELKIIIKKKDGSSDVFFYQ